MNGYSDLLLTMGALILFGAYAMQMNRMSFTNEERSIVNEAQVEAVNLAENVINQASMLPFDEVTAEQPLQNNNPAHLTHRDDFGMSPGQTVPKDFDDYDQLEWTQTGVFGEYTVSNQVNYLMSPQSMNPTPYRTLFKRLTVTVSHNALEQPVVLRYVKSYH